MPEAQDLHEWLKAYEAAHPDDVLVVDDPLEDVEVAALVWELAAAGRHELLRLTAVRSAAPTEVVTNLFASRRRVERMLGAAPGELHRTYQARAGEPRPVRDVGQGPVLDLVERGDEVDLTRLPLLRHFEGDRGRYITNGIVVAEDPDTGVGNLSYHRATVASPTELATSLHSRGDLWRALQASARAGRPLPVAMVVGSHPLFMLAASARVPADADERELAGGLLGAPLEVVRTPTHGIAVPATADVVIEGTIDPEASRPEGPFGEFTGYSSDRSTNNVIAVDAVLRRADALWVDVVGGNSDDHLNLARLPREAEMAEKLADRFPAVTRLHYPSSGTHFHAYVAVRQQRPGEARQVLLGLLGWDPYLKTVVAVDDDVDVTDDGEVLWAMATHVQPAEDVFVVDRLPGSALDPSSSATGTTSRMGIDATRGPAFHARRIEIADEARARARDLLARAGGPVP